MSGRNISCLLILVVLGMATAPLTIAASYFETTNGDLSNLGAAPTTLNLGPGANMLTAHTGGADYDILKLVLPAWHTINSISLASYSGQSPTFVGAQFGSTWTAGTGAAVNFKALAGWTMFGSGVTGAAIGDDILDNMGTHGSAAFSAPLLSGSYAFLFQNTSGAATYSLAFNVEGPPDWIPGDFDGDQHVGPADLSEWREYFGEDFGADADGDFDVDGSDFLVWQRNLARAPIVGAPEPTSALLAAVAAGAGSRRRSRKGPLVNSRLV